MDDYAKWLGQAFAKPLGEKMPADWALKEAQRRAGLPDLVLSGLPQWQVEFARMIEKHEQPPVDPEWEAMRLAITAYNRCRGDQQESVDAALAAFRKHKEAGE